MQFKKFLPKFKLKRPRFPRSKKGRGFLIFLALIIVFGIGGIIGAYFFILKDIPSTAVIGTTSYPQSNNIYDRDGTLLYSFYASRNQSFVSFEQIPDSLKQATLAIEDRDFYNHGAIDIRGIVRAFLANVQNREITEGASTITQQLVRANLLTLDRTIERKVKEIILSFIVESIYSKDKIFEMYLNQVPYGGTAWGVQAASYVYFDKPVNEINLAEAAFIAGLPQAPSIYSPFGTNPEAGKARQVETLNAMLEEGYITQEERDEAIDFELEFSEVQNKILAPHFVFYVQEELVKEFGQERVDQGGLNVTTSINLEIQDYAQASVAAEVESLKNLRVSNGAAMITKPDTGEILAMVGSRDYFDSENDGEVNVTTSLRQPGSSIKPINYATGLSIGYTAATAFIDDRICFPSPGQAPYCPRNYDGSFHGVVLMREALAQSLNIPAVKMLKANGVETMIATASAMGITTFNEPERYGLSLTLGGGEVKMVEMAEAFGVFANGGYRVPIQPILKVTDSRGDTIFEYEPPKSPIFAEKVLPEGVAYIISNILSDNNARAGAFGTNSDLRIDGYPNVAAKTGTTNDLRDNWTIGYTPSFLVASWVGNNDNTPMSGVASGVTGASPIFNDLMSYMLEGTESEAFQRPDTVNQRSVCSNTGLPPQEGEACSLRSELFIEGFPAKGNQPNREAVFVFKDTGAQAPEDAPPESVEPREELIFTDLVNDKYCLTCPRPEPSPAAEEGQ